MNTLTLALLNTVETSIFSPASPDPTGIIFLDSINSFFFVDSEVNETNLFSGKNAFNLSLNGSLLDSYDLTDFTYEPTGITVNENNGYIYITDDNSKSYFEIDPGLDQLFFTSDDNVLEFDTTAFSSTDPEGITYAEPLDNFFISDGANSEIFQITIDGSIINQFDTEVFGITDPEGILYNPILNNLLVADSESNDIFEFSISGNFLRQFDISDVNPIKISGLSFDSTLEKLFVTDRGIDNNDDPNENDGRIFEFDFSEFISTDNQTPQVSLGVDIFTSSTSIFLDANVTDDGLPNPPGNITFSWTQIGGPTAQINSPTAEDTSIIIPSGVFDDYTFRLEASDGELIGSDEITISVREETQPNNIYLSFSNGGSIGSVNYEDEDILQYDLNTQTWSLYIDGSDIGLDSNSSDLNAFHIMQNGDVLFSLSKNTTLANVGAIQDKDIIKFNPVSTGNNTTGSFEFHLDGSQVGLDTSLEDIDAIGIAPDGRILVSTKGPFDAVNAVGKDEDIFVFNDTSSGGNVSGAWELYFDSTDIGFGNVSSEDINSIFVDSVGDIYFSSVGSYDVGFTGASSDLLKVSQVVTGTNSNGNLSLFLDGAQNGLSGKTIDGLSF